MSRSQERIRIFCRLRPIKKNRLSQFEINEEFSKSSIKFIRDRNVPDYFVNNQLEVFDFKFDGILRQKCDQEEVFERTTKPCVLSALDGYNSTIFAYGQTSSGKTWTITGGPRNYSDRGVLPRAVHLLFNEIENKQKNELMEYLISVSYLEIYKGKGFDLLDKKANITDIRDLPSVSMFEDSNGNMLLKNINCRRVKNADEAMGFLWNGDANRVLAETEMNPNSSRSHCVFTINIESKKPNSSSYNYSKLHLVDLAGSERVFKTEGKFGKLDKKIFDEARGINLSLHFLERVIVALSENHDHIPYRNSMLTTVLRDSIGGNCKTIMIANINPSLEHLPETISTCRFAQRVASIRQSVRKNERVDPKSVIRNLKQQVIVLKQKLAFYENKDNKNQELNENEISILKRKIVEFCRNSGSNDVLDLGGNYNRIMKSFFIFRDILQEKNINVNNLVKTAPNITSGNGNKPKIEAPNKKNIIQNNVNQTLISKEMREKIKNLQVGMDLQQLEIDILVSMLAKKNQKKRNVGIQASEKENKICVSQSFEFTKRNSEKEMKKLIKQKAMEEQKKYLENSSDKIMEIGSAFGMIDRAKAFQMFRKSFRKSEVVEKTKEELQKKFFLARNLGMEVKSSRDTINLLKSKIIESRKKNLSNIISRKDQKGEQQEQLLKNKIFEERDKYYKKCEQLKLLKEQINHLQKGLEISRIRFNKNFEKWYQTMNFRKQDYSGKK